MSTKSKGFLKRLFSTVLSATCLLSGTAAAGTIAAASSDLPVAAASANAGSVTDDFSWDNATVYFLLTDGSCDCLYNPSDATFAKALHKFAGWTRRYPFHDVWEAIIQNMHRLFPKRTSDDCALALLTTGIGRPDPSHEQSR